MSLYAGILRGDYDALLTWPFAHRLTFTLLDQCQVVLLINRTSHIAQYSHLERTLNTSKLNLSSV